MRADILIVIAHPDDEIFASGTLCLCAERGLGVALVSVTDGSGAHPALLPEEANALGERRTRELQASAEVLGINAVHVLKYRDTASPGTDWDQARLVTELKEIIAKTNPALVLTHGPWGGYGHAAHRSTHVCVMAAANGFSASVFSFCGQVPGAFFTWHFDQKSDVIIDVREFLDLRARALRCHESQVDYFLQPHSPRTIRKHISALFGRALSIFEVGRKRVPIGSSRRFFQLFPREGLVLHKKPLDSPHFFAQMFRDDHRVLTLR